MIQISDIPQTKKGTYIRSGFHEAMERGNSIIDGTLELLDQEDIHILREALWEVSSQDGTAERRIFMKDLAEMEDSEFQEWFAALLNDALQDPNITTHLSSLGPVFCENFTVKIEHWEDRIEIDLTILG